MNNHQRNQQRAYWLIQEKQAQERLESLDKEYIEANARYPIGATVTVLDRGRKVTAKVKGYGIRKNGLLRPELEPLDEKCIFSKWPTIINQQ